MHGELIAEHGGEAGILNAGALSSTLAKPRNLFAYGDDPTIFDLAAVSGYGFVKNHCFVGGNKRVALAAVDVFLRLNGYQLVASEPEAALTFLNLAASLAPAEEEGQQQLARWIEANAAPLKDL
jgi:death-on-curing protein